MNLDSGIAIIFTIENVAQPPLMPVERPSELTRGYFGNRTVGVTRMYQAAGADQRIDKLIRMVWDYRIKAGLYALLLDETGGAYDIPEGGEQYRVEAVQDVEDENGLRMMDLTLVRLEERYDIAG